MAAFDEQPPPPETALTLALQEERLTVSKRVRRTRVRASRGTVERHVAVDEPVAKEEVVIKRVPIGREVDEVPPVRVENGVTIVPVVEEEVVVLRRLILKEEVHLERVRTTERHVETVTLRRQEVTVTRTEVAD